MQKFWTLIFIILECKGSYNFSPQNNIYFFPVRVTWSQWWFFFYMFSFYCSFAVRANQSAINQIFYSEIGFYIWILQATQRCFIFITKGRSLLKKIIQGQQKPKRTMKAKCSYHCPNIPPYHIEDCQSS